MLTTLVTRIERSKHYPPKSPSLTSIRLSRPGRDCAVNARKAQRSGRSALPYPRKRLRNSAFGELVLGHLADIDSLFLIFAPAGWDVTNTSRLPPALH
jgi:hypothetical protein